MGDIRQEQNEEKENYNEENKYSKIREIIFEHIYNNNYKDLYKSTKVYYFMLYQYFDKKEIQTIETYKQEAKTADTEIKEKIQSQTQKISETVTNKIEQFFLILEKKYKELQNKTPLHILKTKWTK